MDTDIQFLKTLEWDLTRAAQREISRTAEKVPRWRRVEWRSWASVGAAVLVVAFAIGAVVLQGRAASNKFSTVGNAVNAPGGGEVLAPPPHKDVQLPSSTATQAGPSATGQPTQGGGAADLSKIVRDGDLTLTIPDRSFPQRFAQVVAIAGRNGGFVLSSQTTGGDSGTLTLRIPAAHLDRAVAQISALGTVDSSHMQGKDVTADYIDYQAHLKIYESRRAILLGLMSHATTISDTLTIESQLEDVQLKIDQIEGQLRFLDDQVAESTLTVELHEPDVSVNPETINANEIRNPSLGRAIARAVQGFLGVVAAVVVGLGYLVPIAILAALLLAVLWLVRRRSGAGA